MKKTIVIFCFLSFLIFTWSIFYVERERDAGCPFCNARVLSKQKFYEDELVVGLVDYRPLLPGHILIIPKRHVERFEQISEEEMVQITRLIKRVNRAVEEVYGTSAYFLLQKNGVEVGQTVPHVHFHYIPRKKGETSTLPILVRLYLTPFRKAMGEDEVERQALRMKTVLLAEAEAAKEESGDHVAKGQKEQQNSYTLF